MHKVAVFIGGDSNVGKSSFVAHVQEGDTFNTKAVLGNTIGPDYTILTYDVISCNSTVKLTLIDMAGQSKFTTLVPGQIRGADAVLLFYDLTYRASFESLQNHWIWLRDKYALKNPCVLLIGNKKDLADEKRRQVSEEEARSWAKEIGALHFYELSAKYSTLEELRMPLDIALTHVLERQPYPMTEDMRSKGVNILLEEEKKQSSCCF